MVEGRRILRDGIVVGWIAYGSVAVFYTMFDLLAARELLYTVDHLGKAVFRGLRDPAVLLLPGEPDLVAVFLYNALHLALSLVIGLIVTRLVYQVEQRPQQARLILAVIVAGYLFTVLAVGWLTAPMRPVIPWWSIAIANALASALAGIYLLNTHPGLWRRFVPRMA